MTKLEESIVYLLAQEEDGRMGILRLAKYLYLADYIFAKTFGKKQTFTGAYSRFNYGAVPVAFYNAINELKKDNIRRDGNVITLVKGTRSLEKLSEKEKACLKKISLDFKGKVLKKVIDASYSTEPMKEIKAKEEAIGEELTFEDLNFKGVQIHPLIDDNIEVNKKEFEEYLKNDA